MILIIKYFSAGRLTAWLRIQRTENSLMEKWFESDSLFRDKVAADFLFRIIQPLEVCPFTLSPNFEFRVPKAATATSTTTSTPTTPSSSPPLSRSSQHATPGTPTKSSGSTPEVININTKVTLTPVSGNNGTSTPNTTPSRRSTNEESKNKTQTPAGTPLQFWEMEPLISASELLVASDEEDAYPPLLDPWNPDGTSQSKKNPGLANKGKSLIKKVKDKIKDQDDEDVKGSKNKGRERAKEKGKEKEKEDDNFDVEVVPWRGSGSTSGGKPNAVWG